MKNFSEINRALVAKKKITLLFAALFFAATVVFAQDTRTPITSCTLTGFNHHAFVVGQTNPVASVTAALVPEEGAVWHVSQGRLSQWNIASSSFEKLSTTAVLTEGKYRFELTLSIDGAAAASYCFLGEYPDYVKIIVDGVEWRLSAIDNYDDECTVLVYSPEFTVDKPAVSLCAVHNYNWRAWSVGQTNPAATVTAALTYSEDAHWSVDASQSHLMKWDDEHSTFVTVADDEVLTVGRYKYTLRIAMDGDAVGTYRFATAAADGENTVVTVDGDPWTVTAVLNFSTSSTVWAESDEFLLRNVVSSCSLTGFDQDAFVIGWQYSWSAIEEGLTAEAGVPWQLASANNRLCKWDAGSGEYKSVANNTLLTEGTYRFAIQLRLDGDAALSYRFKSDYRDGEDAVVTVDGVAWEVEQVATHDTYCYLNAWSPEFEPKANEEAISSVEANSTNSTKVLRDGRLLILRDDKTYTVTGQELK